MITMRRTVRFLDNTVDQIMMIICLILLFIGGYAMYDTWMLYNHAQDKSLLAYKPQLDKDDIAPISEDMVAWLTVDDTNLDYPVMQGIDNAEYLNKDPYGRYSLSGSIYIDSRNNGDFSDDYNLLYGHHMENKMMFGALDDFADEEFLKAHQHGTLIVGNKLYDYTIFAFLYCDARTGEIFSPMTYSVDTVLEYIKENAEVYYEPVSKHILSMSTCKYPESTERTIVIGALTESTTGGNDAQTN